MNYINTVTLIGRAGNDPEIRYFESGKVKVSLSLAVRPPYRSEQPLWFDIEAWGKTAEIIKDYVQKGGMIAVQGEFVFDRWTDQQGNSRSKGIIKAENIELLSQKPQQPQHQYSTTPTSIANANF
ncbi:MAG: single-stranded DNA-binding protein [Scytonematopsis contorta HA4267-MV1]|jgi:single-strand DNA-binding protein|nr:single-stranded DNA-binding protein [Scytonematopsis contorta HA4267-MV1]